MKTYLGQRTMDGPQVTVDGNPLDPRFDLKTLSEEGFEWTYEGEAPAQLALAILADHFQDDCKALEHYDSFMRKAVANFNNDWEMTSQDIDNLLAE
ncbi:DUF6166 domain-containing protein [Fodinicurvata fenggangensis]|uniref:DUF6166 domain-containing protein n=1 Tax=Fodinicurvata fenggangensis TaxID=1121830 RepID=UPI0004794BC0|nr:DUF6166 domain-containing protein [Fodinicurvata fenggangensis]